MVAWIHLMKLADEKMDSAENQKTEYSQMASETKGDQKDSGNFGAKLRCCSQAATSKSNYAYIYFTPESLFDA
jgi:hypothetical protein